MNKTQWYEVFVDEGAEKGTRTVAQFDDLYQAMKYIERSGNQDNYFVDKWEDTDNPRIIGNIK